MITFGDILYSDGKEDLIIKLCYIILCNARLQDLLKNSDY